MYCKVYRCPELAAEVWNAQFRDCEFPWLGMYFRDFEVEDDKYLFILVKSRNDNPFKDALDDWAFNESEEYEKFCEKYGDNLHWESASSNVTPREEIWKREE